MQRFVIRRLIQAAVMIFLMSIIFFTMLHVIPGGPAETIGANNPHITPAERHDIAVKYGLDKPIPVQYLIWLGNALHGDFGFSLLNGRPVTAVMGERVTTSLQLFLPALLLAILVAVIVGVVAAVRQYSLFDYTATILAYVGISTPIFFIALVLQEFLGVQLGILPVCCMGSDDTFGFTSLQLFQDRVIHLLLPVLVLSIQFIAVWSRYLRSSMLDVIKQDYVRTARAKGLGSGAVLFRHALRNGLIPLVTVVALSFGGIFGGAVVTETVFQVPGLGQLFINSLTPPDYPVLVAYLILGSSAVIFFNLVADLMYAVVDPRIRYS